MVIIIIRALIFYILITAMMKLMGKRQIGELQLSELITTLFLSELAVSPVTDSDIPIAHGIIPVILISSIEVVIAFATRKSKRFLIFLNGNPITLFENQEFIEHNLTKARVSPEDVEAQVRINGFENLDEVSKVILERTGKMSILPKKDPNPNQSGD